MPYVKAVGRSPATYPLATLLAASITASACVGIGWVSRPAALVTLAFFTILLAVISYHRLTIALRRDVQEVHGLVNSQHDDLVARIEQLTRLLTKSGIPVPSDPRAEKAATDV